MEYRGHQVFIIHPDRGFRDRLVEKLRDEEYEAFGYGTTDPVALDNRRESVVFIAVSMGGDWDCRTLAESLQRGERDIHLVALENEPSGDCFDSFLVGTRAEITEGILDYLGNAHARGHRHFVRFGNQNASIATFEFHEANRRYAGIIHDISIRGMSCTFRPEPDGSGPRKVKDMQLNLPGHRCSVDGRMTSHRIVAGQIIHVFMFDRQLPSRIIHELHDFIYASLSMKLSVH